MSLPVGPVVYAIYVNGTQQNVFPLDVELRQEWGSHDLFMIRIEIPRTFTGMQSTQFWAENAPVDIIWGRRPDNVNHWYGYVNHVTFDGNSSSGTKAAQITYTLIGTSKPMNTDRNKTWGEVTGTFIAKTIFGSYGLRSVLTSTDWVLPYEVQANESDFAFLNRIADKIGFRMWVSGSTGYFVDPATILSSSSSQGVPNFYLDKRFTQVDTIRQFNMNQGDNLPGVTKATRQIYGIDSASGNVFKATASSNTNSTVTQIYTDWPATDFQTAQNLVQAKQDRSQFWVTACAELFGDSFIYPGKLVKLNGLQLPPEGQGYWLVGSARHMIKASGTTVSSNDKYLTEVTLMRNSTNVIPSLSNTNQITPEFVSCQLLQGLWSSTQATVLYDGVQR